MYVWCFISKWQKTTCFDQHWPSSGFSSERCVCCKSVYIKYVAAYRCWDPIIEDFEINSLFLENEIHILYNTLTAHKSFGWKTWWWPSWPKRVVFCHFLTKHQLDIHCCVIYCNYPTYYTTSCIIRNHFLLSHVAILYKFLEGKYLEEYMVLNMKTGNGKVERIEN